MFQRLSVLGKNTKLRKNSNVLALFLSTAIIACNNNFIARAFVPISRHVVVRNNAVPLLVCSASLSVRWLPPSLIPPSRQLSSYKETRLPYTLNDDGDDNGDEKYTDFSRGDKIQVEVTRFGVLGASVEVIAHKSHEEDDVIPESEPPLGVGLILQREIHYFRSARDGVDVIAGEILPAYVEKVRDDGKLDISFRIPGGKGKAEDLATVIMETLKSAEDGVVSVGDKSTPEAINRMFPGSSKASFKRAVAFLYKKKLVKPGPDSTTLM
uniref:Conserved virulence factor B-like winged helix domain-containing protein n=1 Tax=Eucampia antarctica TaxID=49252 RepID=A0A7S2WIB0_9STRA|mmetsp:Transcript_31079/g.29915  ORF Transcript_31079/g.29915 Transcript_31079/m.29915 type:complete len:268 (+) Transcript_31079:95-898(+)